MSELLCCLCAEGFKEPPQLQYACITYFEDVSTGLSGPNLRSTRALGFDRGVPEQHTLA